MEKSFYDIIKSRRSIYGIGKEVVVSDERIIEILQQSVLHSPTAFNSQSGRAVLLLGQNHNKLWDITLEILRKIVPVESFNRTEQKIKSFQNGYGSILFFEEQKIIDELQKNFPLFKDNIPIYSHNSSGMLQFIVWTYLELEGFGASLQHYNPLIDEAVKKEWNLPESWRLTAQMPFGNIITPAGDKEFSPVEERVRVFSTSVKHSELFFQE